MKKIIKDRPTESLESEFMLAQISRYMNKFDKSMKKSIKSDLKRATIGCSPLVLGLITFLITGNTIIVAIGAAITGAGGIAVSIIDGIKETRKLFPKEKEHGKTSYINEEEDVDQILEKGILEKSAEDFYTERFKQFLETSHIENTKSAEPKQSQAPNLRVVKNNDDVLNKEETMIQLVKNIDVYRTVYKLPPIEIADKEWDLLFDSTYQLFERKGIKEKFYSLMSRLEKSTFVHSLLDSHSRITIYNFIDCLDRIECDEISKKDIALLQKEIISGMPSKNIIEFSSHVNTKK